jgi:hypothetical protein
MLVSSAQFQAVSTWISSVQPAPPDLVFALALFVLAFPLASSGSDRLLRVTAHVEFESRI